jgi:hypothetical protein
MDTIRSNSRRIRVDFCDKKDYQSILNSGCIDFQSQLFDVDKYLPVPKILISSKSNESGYVEKRCQLSLPTGTMVKIIKYSILNVTIVEVMNIVSHH